MAPLILVVDDETDTADLLGGILGLHFPEAEIRVAYRGEAALELVDCQFPQAAVLDLEMPGLDGEGLANALRAKSGDRALTLIALSGSVRRLSALQNSGPFDHLMRKPTDVDGLVRVLAQTLG